MPSIKLTEDAPVFTACGNTGDYLCSGRPIATEEVLRLLNLLPSYADSLEFYANPETYHACGFLFEPPCGGFDQDFTHSKEYGRPMPGKMARKALNR